MLPYEVKMSWWWCHQSCQRQLWKLELIFVIGAFFSHLRLSESEPVLSECSGFPDSKINRRLFFASSSYFPIEIENISQLLEYACPVLILRLGSVSPKCSLSLHYIFGSCFIKISLVINLIGLIIGRELHSVSCILIGGQPQYYQWPPLILLLQRSFPIVPCVTGGLLQWPSLIL